MIRKQRLIQIAAEFEITGLTAYGKSDIVTDLSRKRNYDIEGVLSCLFCVRLNTSITLEFKL